MSDDFYAAISWDITLSLPSEFNTLIKCKGGVLEREYQTSKIEKENLTGFGYMV